MFNLWCFLLVCVHMCVVHVCVWMQVHMCRSRAGQKPTLGVSTQELCTLLFFETKSLFGTWDELISLHLSSQQVQGHPCLSFPSLGVTSAQHCAQLFMWVLWLKLRYPCLHDKPRTRPTEPIYGAFIVIKPHT